MISNYDLFNKLTDEFKALSFEEMINLEISDICLLIKKVVKKIHFVGINALRIGHLAENTDEFLRYYAKVKKDFIDNKELVILLSPTTNNKICNRQLYNMITRNFPIMSSRLAGILINAVLEKEPDLFDYKFLYGATMNYEVFNSSPPQIAFTEEEEKEGLELLERMGIEKNAPFVCFANRDKAYLNKMRDDVNWDYHNHRDAEIRSLIPSVEYLVNQGYYCIRMGHTVEEPFDLDSKKAIDYANSYRSDFGDIYLSAKCKFFFGSATGIICVPSMFNVPTIWVNLIPFGTTVPYYKNDLYIPKKIWYKKEERFLTYIELMESRMQDWGHFWGNYRTLDLDIIDNTPEEILEVVKEMDCKLRGTWEEFESDDELQSKYKAIFNNGDIPFGAPSRIGSDFLKKYRTLFAI